MFNLKYRQPEKPITAVDKNPTAFKYNIKLNKLIYFTFTSADTSVHLN